MNNTQKNTVLKKLSDLPSNILVFQDCLSSVKKFVPLNGKGFINTFSVFPGVTLSFICIAAEQFSLPFNKNTIQINYCRYGRISCTAEHASFRLCTGEFSLHTSVSLAKAKWSLPVGCYEGLTICIDPDKYSVSPPPLLSDAGVTIDSIYKKFCQTDCGVVFPFSESVQSIFSSFFDLPANLQVPYFKLKFQELLLYLHSIPAQSVPKVADYQNEQLLIINNIHEYLVNNLDKHVTIEYLSGKYLINTTTLKKLFKEVYGVSLAAHMKEHRMEKAASLLRDSDKKVEEIASSLGYESQSKFTAAFKKTYGVTPLEYRKHR